LNGKKEAIREMLDYILQQVPVYLSELAVAVDKTDSPAIAKLAHKIKSAALLVGAKQLDPILNELELNEKNRISPEEIKKINGALNGIFSHALAEVKKERLKFI
jgi:HPt (histidine-containing phosphotransfer) domain-containing protein